MFETFFFFFKPKSVKVYKIIINRNSSFEIKIIGNSILVVTIFYRINSCIITTNLFFLIRYFYTIWGSFDSRRNFSPSATVDVDVDAAL